jgi:hypothetical protein
LKQGVAEAQKKAETIAESVCAQLGPPMEIEEKRSFDHAETGIRCPDVTYGRGGIHTRVVWGN